MFHVAADICLFLISGLLSGVLAVWWYAKHFMAAYTIGLLQPSQSSEHNDLRLGDGLSHPQALADLRRVLKINMSSVRGLSSQHSLDSFTLLLVCLPLLSTRTLEIENSEEFMEV